MICPVCGIETNNSNPVCRCGYDNAIHKVEESHSSEELCEDCDENISDDKTSFNKGVVSGIAMMAVAVIWFALGFESGYIYYYPPILFLMGLYKFLKNDKSINESESDGLTSSEYYVTCPTCDAELELEDEEVKNGHCICPKCQQSIDLE